VVATDLGPNLGVGELLDLHATMATRIASVLTPAEAAVLLNVHTKTIERACRRGDIAASREGRRWRIRREDFLCALLYGFGQTSPALRADLRERTLKGKPRQRRAFIKPPQRSSKPRQ